MTLLTNIPGGFITMINIYRKITTTLLLLTPLLFIVTGAAPAMAAAAKNSQQTFASPEEALQSLVKTVRSNDTKALTFILGPGSKEIISSGDPVADKTGREQFVKLYDEKVVIEGAETGRAVFSIGNEDYPHPIPLVKKGTAWRFDTRAGKEELLNRRIGRNELDVIEILRTYVDAQREYALRSRDRGGLLEYAQKFGSEKGKQDSLYWEANEGEEQSPLGPLAAKAAREGYTRTKSGEKPSPYHGYYYKILKTQGENAMGGAYDYVVKGKMIGGFALVAYPAEYGNSGVMTFMVNHEGAVYQKDLGKETEKIVGAMKNYNPDKTWKKVE